MNDLVEKFAVFAIGVLLLLVVLGVAREVSGCAARPPVPDVVAQAEAVQRRLLSIEVLHCEAGQVLVATCEPADVRAPPVKKVAPAPVPP